METWTSTRKGRTCRKTLRENGTSSLYKMPSSTSSTTFLTNRFHVTHYSGVRGLVQQGYILLGHQGLFILSPRHQTFEKYKITEGESGRVMQVVVSKTAFPRQLRNDQKTFTIMSLCTSTTTMQKSVEQPGANQAVTALKRLVLLKKLLPTQAFRCHQYTHHCGGPGCSSWRMGRCLWLHQPPRTSTIFGRFVHMEP